MKKLFLFLSILLCVAFAFAQKATLSAVNKKKLIWSDEFEYNGLPDSTKWGYEHGFVRNSEPQYYTIKRKENARVENGNLVIEARKEDYAEGKDKAFYTSASITTLNKKHFRHGYIEMRAKFNAQQGMWPAFWMLGIKEPSRAIGWPACGEVDFLEYYRNALHANSVYRGPNNQHVWNAKSTKTADLGPNWDNSYHLYKIFWTKTNIIIYVDDVLLNDIPIKDTIDPYTKENPFHKDFYFLVNLALGQAKESIPEKNLPAKFLVDYIRVYKIKS